MDAMGALGLGIVLSLKDNASSLLDKVKAKMTGLKGVTKETLDAFHSGAKNMLLGAGLMAGGAFLLATAFGGPINAAIEFQSVMADVNKVADLSTQEYKEMSSAIIEMSKRIPMTTTELGKIATAFGQSGIAKDQLMDFTEIAAQMGVAMDISAESAGQSMATLAAVLHVGKDGITLVGDAINHLSNNMNATAAGILNFTTRTAGLGQMVGMTHEQLSALGASFLSVGIAPESATRAFNAFQSKLNSAGGASKDVKAAFGALGLDAGEMSRMFKENAAQAMLTFLKAAQGTANASEHLKTILGEGFYDEIARLAAGSDQFAKALDLVGNQSNYANSMLKEYEVRSNTVQNALQLLSNRLEAVKLRLGNLSLPIFGTLINAISWLVGMISKLPTPIYAVIALVAGLAGAFLVGAGALIAFGGLLKVLRLALPLATAGLSALKTALIATRSAMLTTNGMLAAMRVKLIAVKGAFVAVSGPILVLIGLAAIFYAAWKSNFGGIQDAATAIAAGFRMAATASEEGIAKVDAAVAKKLKDAGLWDLAVTMGKVFFRVRVFVRGLVKGFKEGWEDIKASWSRLKEIFAPAIEKGEFFLEKLGLMKGAADSNAESWESWGEKIGKWIPLILAVAVAIAAVSKAIAVAKAAMALFNIVAAANPIARIAMVVMAVIAFMIYNWDIFGKHVERVWDGIKGVVFGFVGFFQGLGEMLVGIFTGNFELIGQGIRDVFDGLMTFFGGWIDLFWGLLRTILGPVEWLLKKMGIIGDPKVKLANQIAGLVAPEEVKKQLLGQANALDPETAERVANDFAGSVKKNPEVMGLMLNQAGAKAPTTALDPETAERVANDFAGSVSAAKKNPEVMGLMLNQAAAEAPATAPGAPSMPDKFGSPTDAPLADTSASVKAASANVNVNNDVNVNIKQEPTVLKLQDEVIARALGKYQVKQEVRRGGEPAYGH
ncbi:MAG: phage tail tape measure protein [Synergistaceae bacterium]|jgi:TP901 family phage tail tape measure protein|nr:phage tail tape measure protein [Synergistaceae bacterium]